MVSTQFQPQTMFTDQREQLAAPGTPRGQTACAQCWLTNRRMNEDSIQPISGRPTDPVRSLGQELVVTDH